MRTVNNRASIKTLCSEDKKPLGYKQKDEGPVVCGHLVKQRGTFGSSLNSSTWKMRTDSTTFPVISTHVSQHVRASTVYMHTVIKFIFKKGMKVRHGYFGEIVDKLKY